MASRKGNSDGKSVIEMVEIWRLIQRRHKFKAKETKRDYKRVYRRSFLKEAIYDQTWLPSRARLVNNARDSWINEPMLARQIIYDHELSRAS